MAKRAHTHVVFELDFKVVVDKLCSIYHDLSELGNIILQCKYFLSHYPNYRVQFVKRHANVAPYLLLGWQLILQALEILIGYQLVFTI